MPCAFRFVHHQGKDYRPLPFSLASFFGVFRLHFEEHSGSRNAAADPISSATESAARSRANAGTLARSDTAANTEPMPLPRRFR